MDFEEARTPSFGHALSDASRFNNLPRLGSRGQDCQDNQCAEEGLNPEEWGDENQPPLVTENQICGVDKRPLLPVALVSSTVASAACVFNVHLPHWIELTGDTTKTYCFFILAHILVLVTMSYTALCDPGQLYPVAADGGEEPALPRRSHKAWSYTYPIRRYDHYCRWLMNVIGLLNHRSFVLMCGGLMFLTVCTGFMDVGLMLYTASRSAWSSCWVLFFHLGYCCATIGFLGPIFWLHVGFVSRNELAYEWKENYNYVAFSDRAGMNLPVNDLSDDEYNDKFDQFEYDSSRNPWDRGAVDNCWAFWFTPRLSREELGEF